MVVAQKINTTQRKCSMNFGRPYLLTHLIICQQDKVTRFSLVLVVANIRPTFSQMFNDYCRSYLNEEEEETLSQL